MAPAYGRSIWETMSSRPFRVTCEFRVMYVHPCIWVRVFAWVHMCVHEHGRVRAYVQSSESVHHVDSSFVLIAVLRLGLFSWNCILLAWLDRVVFRLGPSWLQNKPCYSLSHLPGPLYLNHYFRGFFFSYLYKRVYCKIPCHAVLTAASWSSCLCNDNDNG